jgi:hypothetical protein
MSCKKLQTMQNELSVIINNPNSTSQNYEDYFKKWGIDYSLESTIKKNTSQCSIASAAASSNKLEIPQACVDAAVNLCLGVDNKGAGSPGYDECWKLYRPTMKNINQSSKNTITSNCMVSSLLKDPILEKNKELSLLLNMNLAKQQIDCDDSKTLNNSLSSEERIVRMSNCVNNNVTNQQNIISACSVSDVVQSNIRDIISNCMIISGDVPIEDHGNPNFITSDNSSDTSIKLKKNDSATSDDNNNYYIIISVIYSSCCLSIIIIIIVIIMNK